MKPVEVITIYTSDIVGPGGPPGTAATITVGSTTTSAPGGDAAVTQSGTAQNRVLDFVIPRGAQGPKGEQGDPGIGGVTPLVGTLSDPGFTLPSGTASLPGRSTVTITVPGAAMGSAVSFAIPPAWTTTTYVLFSAFVTAANEVTIRLFNFGSQTSVPAGTWKALVWP